MDRRADLDEMFINHHLRSSYSVGAVLANGSQELRKVHPPYSWLLYESLAGRKSLAREGEIPGSALKNCKAIFGADRNPRDFCWLRNDTSAIRDDMAKVLEKELS